MSLAEIVEELPKLKRDERRELARRLFDFADEDAVVLAELLHLIPGGRT